MELLKSSIALSYEVGNLLKEFHPPMLLVFTDLNGLGCKIVFKGHWLTKVASIEDL